MPSWRATKDVALPEDLVEEVGRIHGYEHVKPIPLVGPLLPARPDPLRALERRGKTLLALDLGYTEIASYVFHGAQGVRAHEHRPRGLPAPRATRSPPSRTASR